MAGWSQDILDQLDPIHREKFPAVLTYRLAELFDSQDIVNIGLILCCVLCSKVVLR